MKKIKFLFIVLVIAISFNCIVPVVLAEEIENSNTTLSEDEEKEKILILINEYIDEINTKIIEIDKKIDKAKEQKEFEYYPAIRLNVDTPMFGLTSIVENKLRIKKDISTSDVAAKYSIRDIITNKKIRIPDSYLGAIVMSTKEYSIDKEMSLSQLKLTLVKCIQYLSQVNSVNDFIDTQINNIFRDYIDDSKKANINDVKYRVKKVSNDLVQISDKISKLEFLGVDVSNYKSTYLTLSKELYSINVVSKNTLILDSDLNELIKNSLANESSVLDLNTKVSETYETTLEDIDYALLLENVAKKYNTKIGEMSSYIENSTKTTKKVEGEKEEIITTTNYDVTSNATLDYLKLSLEEVNGKIEENKKLLEDKSKEQESNTEDNKEKKTEEELKQEKQLKINENSDKVDALYIKYKEVINREYRFYTSNINMLIKDSNDKVSTIISEIDSGIKVSNDIFDYTKYIYIDLPEYLKKCIDENNIDSSIELENLIKLLKEEVTDLSNKNTNITKLYNEILEEALKS